jgi:phage gpG-like protein
MLAPPEVPITPAQLQSLPSDVVELLEDGDFSGVFRKAMYDLEKDHREFFAGEHTPDGTPWLPLAESTIRRKGHDTILRDTGRLNRSLTSGGLTSDGESVREIVDEGPNKGFSFGTSVPYGIIHQEGAPVGKIPRREFLGFTEERIDQIEQDLLDRAEELFLGGQ